MNNKKHDDISIYTIFTLLLAGCAFFWIWFAAVFAAKFLNRLVLG